MRLPVKSDTLGGPGILYKGACLRQCMICFPNSHAAQDATRVVNSAMIVLRPSNDHGRGHSNAKFYQEPPRLALNPNFLLCPGVGMSIKEGHLVTFVHETSSI